MSDPLMLVSTLVFTAFAFAFGACFGSFQNVLVWRMPRRMPIAMARSHCPKCKHAILGQDNIPLIGWLRLRGKCRFCGLPISARYPLIEGAVATLGAVLFLLIVVGHGLTLPENWMPQHTLSWLSEFPHCEMLVVFLHQFVFAYFLLTYALIDEDRQDTPWKFLLIGLIFHVALIIWEPGMNQMDRLSDLRQRELPAIATWESSAVQSAAGMIVALLISGILRLLKTPHRPTNHMQALLLTGLFLGPLFTLWASLIAGSSLLVQLLGSRLKKSAAPATGFVMQLFWAWLLILFTWRWWPAVQWPTWPV